MKTTFVLLVVLMINAQAEASEKRSLVRCLPALESRIGKPAISETSIFGMTDEYAMEIVFGDECEIIQLRVQPKWTLEYKNPEWVESDHTVRLNSDQYAEVLSKLSELRNIGSLIHKGAAGMSVVTNSKEHQWDEHENGVINRVVHCCADQTVFAFTIYFLHNVDGEIRRMITPGKVSTQLRQVLVNDDWYFVSSTEKVVLGKRRKFRLAGPIR